MNNPTEVDIALSILDHQLVDCNGQNCGKVDDLEISRLDSNAPEVTTILAGGTAWRSRGLLGRLLARFSGNAVHIPWQEVDSVTTVVTLKHSAADLRLNRGDERLAKLIRKVPRAG